MNFRKAKLVAVNILKNSTIPLGVGLLFLVMSFWMDASAQLFFQRWRPDPVAPVMEGLSYYGRGWSLTLLAALSFVLGFLVRKRSWSDAGLLCLSGLAISSLAVQLVKHLAGRPRPRLLESPFTFHGPYLRAGMEGLDSFPSGHAITTFALAAILARCYPRARYLVYGVATAVSFSRIYLGAHYVSDVAAGTLLGLLCGGLIDVYAGRLLEFAEKRKDKLMLGAVLTCAGILFFYQLKAIPLFDVDEAVFAETTREMMETGNFLTPVYNSAPRFDKPILFYWLMSSAFALLGVNELGARFWPALAGCGLVAITFLFARATAGLRCGLLSALILATSLEILVLTHLAITDMVLTFFLAAALYSFYLALQCHSESRSGTWALIGWAAAALAALTKGPIAILLPAVIVALFIWLSGNLQNASALRFRAGAALFCLIALPWYAVETYVTQGEFLRVFFLQHNVLRYVSVDSGHEGPWFYYLVVVSIGFLPWSAFLPASVSTAWPNRSRISERDREGRLSLFLLLWAAVVLLFFSTAQTKLPNYVAPLFPALSILTGWWCERFLLNEPGRSARLSAIGGGLVGSSLSAGFLLLYLFMDPLQSRISFTFPLDLGLLPLFLSLVSAGAACGFFLILRAGKTPQGFAIIAISMTIFAFSLYESLIPRVSRYLQEPLHRLASRATTRSEAQARLIVFGLNKPSLLFYTKGRAMLLAGHDFATLTENLNQPRESLVITDLSLAEKLTGLHTVERQGRYVLLSNRGHERK